MAGPVKKYSVPAVVAEARLTKPAIVLDYGEGNEFRIDPPELWTDEVQDLFIAGKGRDAVKVLLGDQYESFLAVGGSNSHVNLVLEQHRNAMKGAVEDGTTLGESSASSDS